MQGNPRRNSEAPDKGLWTFEVPCGAIHTTTQRPPIATNCPRPRTCAQSPFLAAVSNRTLASMSVRDHSASLPMAPLSRPPTEVLTSPNKSNHAVCRHGRRKVTCKECGGSGLCGHGRQKSTCRECGGSSFCRHGRRKSQCKECGGSSFCGHGRRKSTCKECVGSSVCGHGRQKSTCKECGGSSGRSRSTQAKSMRPFHVWWRYTNLAADGLCTRRLQGCTKTAAPNSKTCRSCGKKHAERNRKRRAARAPASELAPNLRS